MPFPYKKILCPVTFDDNSGRAMSEAAELARSSGSTLCLLHVVHINPLAAQGAAEGYAAGQFYDAQVEDARKQLDQLAAQLPPDIRCEIAIEMGEPGNAIVAAVKQLNADLVVMATHARRGLVHLVLGSVTEKLLRESSVPVLAVRPPLH